MSIGYLRFQLSTSQRNVYISHSTEKRLFHRNLRFSFKEILTKFFKISVFRIIVYNKKKKNINLC